MNLIEEINQPVQNLTSLVVVVAIIFICYLIIKGVFFW